MAQDLESESFLIDQSLEMNGAPIKRGECTKDCAELSHSLAPFRMIRPRRLHITLVEILIVVTILALISGAIGINIMRALKEQRFRTEVGLMVDTLRLAQDLMLIMGRDTHVRMRVAEDQVGIEYFLEVEGGVPEQWEPIVKRTRRVLKETHSVTMDPRPTGEDQLALHFMSGGSLMSKGVFRMSTHEDERAPGALTMAVCLKGYPHPITSILEKGEPIECQDPVSEEFNNRLTFYTVEEAMEDNQLTKSAALPQDGGGGEQDNKSGGGDEKKSEAPSP